MPSESFLYPLHAAVIGLIYPQSPKMGEAQSLVTRSLSSEPHSLYLVLVCTKQLSGHFSGTSVGPTRLGQHCSFRHTLRQKSGMRSARRTILMLERYVFPLYLKGGKAR